jgi:hypothetical protein
LFFVEEGALIMVASNNGGVNEGALAHEHPAFFKMRVDRFENGGAEVFFFQKMTKL